MNTTGKVRYVIGRHGGCDVVVKNAEIAPQHCLLTGHGRAWTVVPTGGKIGHRRDESSPIEWSHSPVQVTPSDDLWLTNTVRFPWPVEEDALQILLIGRAIDCDVTINQQAISGRHAKLIVGPRRTFVLKDYQSRNGIFADADRAERVDALALFPSAKVYFGSHAIDADELMSAAAPTPPGKDSAPSDRALAANLLPSEINTAAKISPWPSSGVGRVASWCLPTLMCGLAIWWWVGRSAQVEKEASGQSPLATAAMEAAASPESAAGAAIDTAGPSPTISAQSVDGSLYWILVQHDNSGAWFRLGCGTALSPDTIVTTATIVRTIDQLTAEGYSLPSVVSVAGGSPIRCGDRTVWQVFVERDQRVAMLRKQHDRLQSVSASAEDLQRSAELLNFALETASAADVAWIHVAGLSAYLQLGDADFHPGSSISLVDAGFDAEDPYYADQASNEATDISTAKIRVHGRGPNLDDVDGGIKLAFADARRNERNLIGTPLMQGTEMVGMIVFQSATSGSPPQVEAVHSRTIRRAISANDSATSNFVKEQ